MKMTTKQQSVFEELRKIGRENFERYRVKSPHLHTEDRRRLEKGDEFCAFGMGGLSYQVGSRIGMTAGSVLSIFKALERKGFVMRETRCPHYQRPLYWWPVGLAFELLQDSEQKP